MFHQIGFSDFMLVMTESKSVLEEVKLFPIAMNGVPRETSSAFAFTLGIKFNSTIPLSSFWVINVLLGVLKILLAESVVRAMLTSDQASIHW